VEHERCGEKRRWIIGKKEFDDAYELNTQSEFARGIIIGHRHCAAIAKAALEGK
jgi:hypothetical protein